jgi:hypothetical protein
MKTLTIPIAPPYEVLKLLAGDPLILSASDEQAARNFWADVIELLKKEKLPDGEYICKKCGLRETVGDKEGPTF